LTTEEATLGAAEDATGDPPTEDSAIRIVLPLLPLENYYTSAEQALEAINDFALNHGYTVVKRRSKITKSKNNPVLKKVQLKCDRRGVY
jgi:hypothetical protein